MNNAEELNTQLYEKMKAEQDKYRDWLLSQPPAEILNHTYEYTIREDILMCMEDAELSPKQAKALLKSPCPSAIVMRCSTSVRTGIWTIFVTPLIVWQTELSERISKKRSEKAGKAYAVY